jgi:hypothetical protein
LAARIRWYIKIGTATTRSRHASAFDFGPVRVERRPAYTLLGRAACPDLVGGACSPTPETIAQTPTAAAAMTATSTSSLGFRRGCAA